MTENEEIAAIVAEEEKRIKKCMEDGTLFLEKTNDGEGALGKALKELYSKPEYAPFLHRQKLEESKKYVEFKIKNLQEQMDQLIQKHSEITTELQEYSVDSNEKSGISR